MGIIRIVVDAMGSDQCPIPDVKGAVLAVSQVDAQIILVGDESRIKAELSKYTTANLKLEIVHAPETITMSDKPSAASRHKSQSSMHIGMSLVRDGLADAFVTMGNTGVAYAIAMLVTLKRIKAVKRPALSAIFPILGKPVIFLDVGANADCKPEWLVQFGVMGAIYAENALGLANPRIAILSNGEEEGKGTQLIQESIALLRTAPINFVGNVEPTDIFSIPADVVVSDGFTGNILTKTFEGATRYLVHLIREEIRSSLIASVGGLLITPAMKRVHKRIDTFEVGGAPLLGVNGVVIIGHGSSNANAVKNAILQAKRAVDGQIVQAIERKLAGLSSSNPHPSNLADME